MRSPDSDRTRLRARRLWLQPLDRRGRVVRAVRAAITLGILSLGGLGGCSFGEEASDVAEQNSCQVASDCATQYCEEGRCVAHLDADDSMEVTVVVTPKRTPSGSQPLPIVAKPFILLGGDEKIELALPVSVPVNILKAGKPIAAQASFVPLDTTNRYTAKTTKLTILPAEDSDRPLNNAMLLDGQMYRVQIEPSDTSLPPHSLVFRAERDATLEVDYDSVDTDLRRFDIRGMEPDVRYQLRAVSATTGAPISATAEITGKTTSLTAQLLGKTEGVAVELLFDAAGAHGATDVTDAANAANVTGATNTTDEPYLLELSPAERSTYSTGTAEECGDEEPKPRISVPSSAFESNDDGALIVKLPALHPAVAYSGSIELCSSRRVSDDLQVMLKTEDLYLASGDSDTIEGEFETVAAASWDAGERRYKFCARIPPGTYTVVVTPPPSAGCEIFAERRVLGPDWAEAPDELGLRRQPVLSATVLTPDRMPMPKATIELLALGSSAVTRALGDRIVPGFNRSSTVSTDIDGSFTLPVDRGQYDVLVKPPETSNYAWSVIYEVAVASAEAEFAFTTEVMLAEPVAVTGQLSFIDGKPEDQASLAGAEVRAYTLIDVEGDPTEQRSVEIGSGQADGNGAVTLLLPPTLQRSWNP